jgi:predicted ATPase/DNA-binding SARP family transcriptional activator/Tfp pilus assembly protein PilF
VDALFCVEMLGRFVLRQGSREITRFRTQKTGSLLGYLALYGSRSHPRDVLIELFWPDSDLKAARTNLSVALNALRRQLEPPGILAGAVILANRAQVRLNPHAFTTDTEAFEDALRQAETQTEAAEQVAFWRYAIELYRGDLMPGYYEDWVLTERDRLRDAYLRTLRQIIQGYARLEQPEQSLEYAHRLVQADRLDEDSHRILMRLLIQAGRQQDAWRQYLELESLLRRELQTTPSAPTREIASQLGNALEGRTRPPRRTSLLLESARHAPNDTGARDLPFLSGSDSPGRAVRRLPSPFTRFFGREDDLARLKDVLRPTGPSAYRLVTLTGPGGTGKTRLSIEAADRVSAEFGGDLWFVPLADVESPLRIGEVLRDALELPHSSCHSSALDQVVAFLNGRKGHSLLVLDNFEHIVSGGAAVVWTLLNRVPLLHCLVTSRHALALPGERDIPVSPLPTPPPPTQGRDAILDQGTVQTISAYPSVALFIDRAQTVRPEFQITSRNAAAIAAICEKLEGIPLAIELAAARARVLTPAQMRERLEERFTVLASRRGDKGERHRSLWAAMEWSYHLLPLELQQVFARLSVFRGGWTAEAAYAVAGSSLLNPDGPTLDCRNMLDCLAQLRGHSLIQAQESSTGIRFGMLDTLREFAREQLSPDEHQEMEWYHATYFHHWVSRAQLIGVHREGWYRRFEEDFDNLRAVLAWSLRQENDIVVGLETASSMGSFWWLRGHLAEGRRWYSQLLEGAEGVSALAGEVGFIRSLKDAGALAYLQGDFAEATSLLERCIEAARLSGNEAIAAIAWETLGSVAYRQGNYDQARTRYETALAGARKQGLRSNEASALGNLANVAQSCGDFDACLAFNEACLQIWREAGERNGESRVLHNLAHLAQSQGRFGQARTFYEQSLAIKRELADPFGVSVTLRGIAEVAVVQGDYPTAAAYLRESLAMARVMDARPSLLDLLRSLSSLVQALGEREVAARMLGTMERAQDEMNYPLPPVARHSYETNQAALRQILGAASYDTALTEGRNLSLEQALAILEDTLASHNL